MSSAISDIAKSLSAAIVVHVTCAATGPETSPMTAMTDSSPRSHTPRFIRGAWPLCGFLSRGMGERCCCRPRALRDYGCLGVSGFVGSTARAVAIPTIVADPSGVYVYFQLLKTLGVNRPTLKLRRQRPLRRAKTALQHPRHPQPLTKNPHRTCGFSRSVRPERMLGWWRLERAMGFGPTTPT